MKPLANERMLATAPARDVPARRDRLLALLSLALLAGQAVAGPAVPGFVTAVGVGVAIGVTLAATWWGSPSVRGVTTLVPVLMAISATGLLWQPAMAVALVLVVLIGTRLPGVLPAGWRERGRVPLGWTLLVAGVTPLGLLSWTALAHPDLGDVVGRYLPDLPFAVLLLGGVGFAVVNAALEELIWRGILQQSLVVTFGPGLAIALQAVSFGLQHAHGVPRGAVGVCLAGSWAVMLGLLRRHTGGLLAPFLAHFVADAVIAGIVFSMAQG